MIRKNAITLFLLFISLIFMFLKDNESLKALMFSDLNSIIIGLVILVNSTFLSKKIDPLVPLMTVISLMVPSPVLKLLFIYLIYMRVSNSVISKKIIGMMFTLLLVIVLSAQSYLTTDFFNVFIQYGHYFDNYKYIIITILGLMFLIETTLFSNEKFILQSLVASFISSQDYELSNFYMLISSIIIVLWILKPLDRKSMISFFMFLLTFVLPLNAIIPLLLVSTDFIMDEEDYDQSSVFILACILISFAYLYIPVAGVILLAVLLLIGLNLNLNTNFRFKTTNIYLYIILGFNFVYGYL